MSEIRLTVMGSAGSYPGPARACSSYLVEHEGFRLLLDVGNGSLTNLQQRMAMTDIDVLMLSHRHPDHWADLVGMYYALRFHPDGERSVEVYAPAGVEDFIRQLLPDDDEFGRVCRFHVVAPGDEVQLGPLRVRLFRAYHLVDTLAFRVEAAGRVLAYSADSDSTPELSECARDADLFVCDCTWSHSDDRPEGIHMSGRLAGKLAADAGARRLLVTHVWPGADAQAIAAEVAESFGGEILVAEDLMEIVL
jgi:ribonuclease BN (tRNA processing enzyme)